MLNYLLVLVLLINFIILDDHRFFKSISNHLFNNPLEESTHSSSNVDGELDSSTNRINRLAQARIDCREFEENVSLIRKIADGVVKEVWLGKWSSLGYIAVSFLKSPVYSDDFIHNIHMLSNFSHFNSRYTVQYLGNCDHRILFTKFYKLGPLSNLFFLLKESHLFKQPLQSRDCFQFCIRYAKVIDYLHNSPIGTRVMCDSNDLAKLASQFLIDDDLSIVANDLDALPDASSNPIQCGNRSLIGDLIAPEQKINSFYDQSIDIYKIPFVCNYLLSLCAPPDDLLDLLVSQLHTKCLHELPSQRPTSKQLVREYLRINYTLFN